jgi:hypothetical protein
LQVAQRDFRDELGMASRAFGNDFEMAIHNLSQRAATRRTAKGKQSDCD